MKDIANPNWIKSNGILFLLMGIPTAALLLLEHPTWRVVLLLLTTWYFCWFYYFAIYVIEHYVDSDDKFSGLWSFARYLIRSNLKPACAERYDGNSQFLSDRPIRAGKCHG